MISTTLFMSMDIITIFRFTLIVLLEIYFVVGQKQRLIYGASEKEKLRPNGEPLQRLSHLVSIRRSLNDDMRLISRLLLPLRTDWDETNFRHRLVRSLRNNMNSSNFLTSSNVQKMTDIAHSKRFNANIDDIILNSREQGSFFSKHAVNSNNKLSLYTSNNALHHHNHQTLQHLNRKQSRLRSRDQFVCGPKNHSQIELQLLKNWDLSSCDFARLKSYRNSNGCLVNCPASQAFCCLLQNLKRESKNYSASARRKSKRNAEERIVNINDYSQIFEENLRLQSTQTTHSNPHKSHRKRKDPFRDNVKGDTVKIPCNSRNMNIPKKVAFPGLIVKESGRILCIHQTGKITAKTVKEIDEYCK